ncbi:MAG: hypothetical protein HQL97_15375 [Magnetococcales bacterium]|nr:hypothetical protein [Magnetococcales bacterium]
MKTRIHALAGIMALLTIALFCSATLVAELFLSIERVVWVKQMIVTGLWILIPLLMITGGSGFALGKGGSHPLIRQKQRRMPRIAANGLLILVPSALFLASKAEAGAFDVLFYGVQGLELVAGALNLTWMGLNVRDGLRMRNTGGGFHGGE